MANDLLLNYPSKDVADQAWHDGDSPSDTWREGWGPYQHPSSKKELISCQEYPSFVGFIHARMVFDNVGNRPVTRKLYHRACMCMHVALRLCNTVRDLS